MEKLLAKDVAKGRIQDVDARQARERVSVVDHAVGLRALRDSDMVIEVRRQRRLTALRSWSVCPQGCFGEPRAEATYILRVGNGDEARRNPGYKYIVYFYH